ncbi:MAG: prepilin signal peptidase PulO-like enzyme (type II secretory pathway) [Candidatus Azotimanducaceae bacterium]|jgi:prepilin signal peptidase PulO-like enzyme (type II secretory pathway)
MEFLEVYLAGTMFVFGAIIGSFLNVVIYRFHTGKSLSGNSHCMSCLRRLRWFELFPLFSYLVLRGKCRTCRSHIPPRYFIVELITACAFYAIYMHGGSVESMFLMGGLFTLLLVISVYDINHYIIPNELVILTGVLVAGFYGSAIYSGASFSVLIPASLSALGAFLFYGGLWKFSKGRWIGFGDAKLAIPLGFLVGFPAVFSMIVLSFWIGAFISVLLIGIQAVLKRGQIHLHFLRTPLKMKSEIPFAPFLIAGFIASYFYDIDVLSLITYVL